MVRRWIGVDINGWRDFAARDWTLEEDDPALSDKTIHLVDGGSGSVVVRLEDGSWVGGPQAALAPHGRGGGWGKVGEPARRCSVGLLLSDLQGGGDSWAAPAAAVVKALSPGAHDVMLAVPDVALFDEAVRGRLLAMMRKHVRLRAQLTPRGVALFHGAADTGWETGRKVRLVIHDAEGLEIQHLTLRDADGFPGHRAPERLGYGVVASPLCGLKALGSGAERQVRSVNPRLAEGDCEQTRLPLALLFGEAARGDGEALRNASGDWVQVSAPELDLNELFAPDCVDPCEVEADLTILCTPLGGAAGARLEALARARFGELRRVEASAIARGALICGRLKQRDLPHYLDRLEPISLAVNATGGPRWEPLIPTDRNVPANREYVSDPMDGFIWPAGGKEIEFYVLKGESEVRHWRAMKEDTPDAPARVSLRLRQTPGQSWARLRIGSDDWPSLGEAPIELDWERLAPEGRTPEAILAELERPKVVVPERIIEPANIGLWDGSLVNPGVEAALSSGEEDLYRALARVWSGFVPGGESYGKSRPISTDGELPASLSPSLAEHFEARLQHLANQLIEEVTGGRTPTSSRPLLCLTWSFTKCPEPVVDLLLEAFDALVDRKDHPILRWRGASVTVQAGLGRVVRGETRIRRMLHTLSAMETWSAASRGALSYVLSRRADAPQSLWLGRVNEFAERLTEDLAGLIKEKRLATDFKYILMTLVGLLRFRAIDPNALTASSSKIARILSKRLESAKTMLETDPRGFAQTKQKIDILDELIAMLSGEGGDANLLLRIEALKDG